MKKCLLLLLALNLLAPMPIRASYVVISSDGSVIEEKDSHDVQSVASISKIMTALVVLEHSELNEIVTISYDASHQVGSSIYLKEGQQVTLITCLLYTSYSEIAAASGYDVSDVLLAFDANQFIYSLDEPIYEKDGNSLYLEDKISDREVSDITLRCAMQKEIDVYKRQVIDY